jgi:hypothetical protein
MKLIVLHSLVTLIAVTLGIGLYHRTVLQPALVVGVVDVAEVYRAKEAEFTRMLTASRTEQEREQARAMVQRFSHRLAVALSELPKECGCPVVLKTSLIGAPQSLDLTAALRRKVDAP